MRKDGGTWRNMEEHRCQIRDQIFGDDFVVKDSVLRDKCSERNRQASPMEGQGMTSKVI